MSRHLDCRLSRLEHHVQVRDLPPWPEVYTAATWLRTQAVALLKAAVHAVQHGQPVPTRDETQYRADAEDRTLVDRWCRAWDLCRPGPRHPREAESQAHDHPRVA